MARKSAEEIPEIPEINETPDIPEENINKEKVEIPAPPKEVPVYFPPVTRPDEENFVLVMVNGKRYQIQKGVQVMVPPEVAEVIRNSERETAKIAERMIARESKL